MPAFIVGTIKILQPDAYARYTAAIKGLSAQFGGEPLLAGPVAALLEGQGPADDYVIVTKFPTADQAREFLTCPSYRAAKQLRDGAANIELRLIEV